MNTTDRAPTALSDEANHERSIHGLHGVGYQSTDVRRAADFYTRHLGFKLEYQQLPAFATVSLGGFKLCSAAQERQARGRCRMDDGRKRADGIALFCM